MMVFGVHIGVTPFGATATHELSLCFMRVLFGNLEMQLLPSWHCGGEGLRFRIYGV